LGGAISVLLEARNLQVYYHAVQALDDVSFAVDAGEVVALIGPNGAGKSTAMKAVTGLIEYSDGRITSGQVYLNGQEITNRPADQLAAKGVAVVPDGRRVFHNMTVLENLRMGAYLFEDKAVIGETLNHVLDLFAPLKALLKRTAGTLSGGEQQMVAIGRALMLRPVLLIADEPSVGLSPNYVETIFDKFAAINREGTTVLIVEQNVMKALELAHRAYLFDIGRIVTTGTGRDMLKSLDVKKSFLGA
jgi:branched-chain amino acid transport system ATP-binding protein